MLGVFMDFITVITEILDSVDTDEWSVADCVVSLWDSVLLTLNKWVSVSVYLWTSTTVVIVDKKSIDVTADTDVTALSGTSSVWAVNSGSAVDAEIEDGVEFKESKFWVFDPEWAVSVWIASASVSVLFVLFRGHFLWICPCWL